MTAGGCSAQHIGVRTPYKQTSHWAANHLGASVFVWELILYEIMTPILIACCMTGNLCMFMQVLVNKLWRIKINEHYEQYYWLHYIMRHLLCTCRAMDIHELFINEFIIFFLKRGGVILLVSNTVCMKSGVGCCTA